MEVSPDISNKNVINPYKYFQFRFIYQTFSNSKSNSRCISRKL